MYKIYRNPRQSRVKSVELLQIVIPINTEADIRLNVNYEKREKSTVFLQEDLQLYWYALVQVLANRYYDKCISFKIVDNERA